MPSQAPFSWLWNCQSEQRGVGSRQETFNIPGMWNALKDMLRREVPPKDSQAAMLRVADERKLPSPLDLASQLELGEGRTCSPFVCLLKPDRLHRACKHTHKGPLCRIRGCAYFPKPRSPVARGQMASSERPTVAGGGMVSGRCRFTAPSHWIEDFPVFCSV